ncbi:MAG TPA: efflux RND transporter periplasmic adaptor subunit [Pyrinomonadaceae bacterium]|jgi:HlyD family secretion protein|nr:efflux RND transporter periplasmic adaptor subunit [Pyrinomonadaceae bacterium]
MKKLKAQLKRRKSLAALLAVALLGVAGVYMFRGGGASAAEYTTARVERGNLRNTVTATGTLQAVTTVQVGSQASGTISALYADFNSTVKKGQVVAQLDPSTTQAQVDQARANLEQARAGLTQARAGLTQAQAGVTDARAKALAAGSTTQNQRAGVTSAEANLAVLKAQLDDAASLLRQQESLAQSGIISRREYETALTSYKTAEARYKQAQAQLNQAVLGEQSAAGAGQAQAGAQVEQARAQVQQAQAQVLNAQAQVEQAQAALRLAEVNLNHTTIRSPIDGVVVSRDVDVGQTVAASLSAPTLFTIAQDLTQMQVMADIDQADIGLVEKAKAVQFDVDAFPGDEFKGAIRQIRLNPESAQNVVTYNVVIDVANPEQKLKPGMTANLTVTVDGRDNVVKVPNSALRFSPRAAQGQTAGGNNSAQGALRAARRQGEQAGQRGGDVTPPTAPVLEGQTRRVWVLGADGRAQPRRIKVGLSDGVSTEVVEGELHEGDMVVTGQTVSGQQTGTTRQQGGQSTPPGFGAAPRVGGGGGGRR